MTARKRLMNLSFIALAVFSACTDEVGNGGLRPVKGDHSLSFAVSTPGSQTWTKADGTRAASAPATQELEPVEMEGKVNGKTVYLTAEVTDGFPGDNRPMTRGTQVTEDNKTKDGIMETFAVSAYTDIKGTPDFMYSVPTTKGSPENGTTYWYPEEKFYWPGVKSLNFYAWYPHTANAEGLTVSGADENGTPKLHYIAPEDVKKQMDVMTAVATNQAEQEAIPLTFDHALSAVKFKAGNLSGSSVKSITIEGLKYVGTYKLGDGAWNLEDNTKDFKLDWENNPVTGTTGTPITSDNETLFMIPQELSAGVKVVVVLNDGDKDFTLSASIGGMDESGTQREWKMGYTYTYSISFNYIWEEPSRNLPAGKQLLNNGEHKLVYDFAVTGNPIINGKGKFVITPIYADGSVCSEVEAKEVPFTVSGDRTKVTLDLDANPNYNLLRMIQIKVTAPDGSEKTLNTVDFQEAKTDASNIVVWPEQLTSDLSSITAVSGKKVGAGGTMQRGDKFDLAFSDVTSDASLKSGDFSGMGSVQNGILDVDAAINGWESISNLETNMVSYLEGSDIILPSAHTKSTVYGRVNLHMTNWAVGTNIKTNTVPNGYWVFRTSGRTSLSTPLGTITKTSSPNVIDQIYTNRNDFEIETYALDLQKAGLEHAAMHDNGTGNNSYWTYWMIGNANVIAGGNNTEYWGYMGVGHENKSSSVYGGSFFAGLCISGHKTGKLDVPVGNYEGGFFHNHNSNGTCYYAVMPCYNGSGYKSTNNSQGIFYNAIYTVKYVTWSFYRDATGIAENVATDLNKQ